MKIPNFIRIPIYFILFVTGLQLTACSKSSDNPAPSSGAGGTISTVSLANAIKPTLQTGAIVTTTLQRRDQSKIVGASTRSSIEVTNAPGLNNAVLNITDVLTSDLNGSVSVALPSGATKLEIFGTALNAANPPAPATAVNAVTGHWAPVVISETIGTTSTFNSYRGEEYQWTIVHPNDTTSVTVDIVQVDATGKPDYGTFKFVATPLAGFGQYAALDSKNPNVLSVTKAVTLGAVSTQVNTELLPGSYKAVITAVSTTPVATYVSPATFTSSQTTSSSGSVKTQNVNLATGKAVSVTLKDNTGNLMAGRTVDFYDSTSWVLLGSATTNAPPGGTPGTASITVDSGTTSVTAHIYTPVAAPGSDITDAVYVFDNIGTTGATATLQQQTVAGTITPNTTCSLIAPVPPVTTIGTVEASPANPNLMAGFNFITPTQATVSSTGGFSLKLFGPLAGAGLPYKLKSNGVDGCPDVTATDITVAAATVHPSLTAAGGGTIVGKISTKAGASIVGKVVDIWQSTTTGYLPFKTVTTDPNGNYQAQVPYGTYMMWVDGSVTEGITVSAAAPQQVKNLTEFSLMGQVSKSMGGSSTVANTPIVFVGTNQVTASNLGVYTINVMEGKTWFCTRPNIKQDLGYVYNCDLNVMVDAAAVAAAGQ